MLGFTSKRIAVNPFSSGTVGLNTHSLRVGNGSGEGSTSPITLYPRYNFVRCDDGGDTSWNLSSLTAQVTYYKNLGYKTLFLFNQHWSDSSTLVSKFSDIVNTIKPHGIEFFNEVDISSAGGIVSPAQALEDIRSVRAAGLPCFLLSPSVSNWRATGQAWATAFAALGGYALCDACSIHPYLDPAVNVPGDVAGWVASAASLSGKPVVCTEFGIDPASAATLGLDQSLVYELVREAAGVPIVFYDAVYDGSTDYSFLSPGNNNLSALGIAVNSRLAAASVHGFGN